MKKFLILVLAFALGGCSALVPAAPTAMPTSPPIKVIQTVIVTVLVTAPASETPIPTATWTSIPTFTPQPTSLTGTPATPQLTGTLGTVQVTGTPGTPVSSLGTPSATLPANAGGTLFSNLTRSGDMFGPNCQPDTITFGVSTTDPSITEVDLFYRLEDQTSSSITNWVDIGKMISDNAGNFTFDFKAGMIPSDLRSRRAWFDYQFVGLNSTPRVIGRSALILQQITFTPTCQ